MEHALIGLLHPGQMGSTVGSVLVETGHRVLWASTGRSRESCERATKTKLDDVGTLEALTTQVEIIFSICPPHAAFEVAKQVADCGFTGIFADCNAISPQRTRIVEATIAGAGATYVDGSIIGGPPINGLPGTTIYLSGAFADRVAACFSTDSLQSVVLSGRIGAASAIKMCYAANTKGTAALFTAILALAEREGVRNALEKEWGESLSESAHKHVTESALKAWRFAGEMREISETFAESGLPSGFHAAASEIYELLSCFKGHAKPPKLGEILKIIQRIGVG